MPKEPHSLGIVRKAGYFTPQLYQGERLFKKRTHHPGSAAAARRYEALPIRGSAWLAVSDDGPIIVYFRANNPLWTSR
ncbi:hypothetical protein ETD86_37715 [Nonomuraea turkmeniaca]|uniref:Uncharacterized protein n=1 Tax=Nonomuraea turkmeniaca TaxID=103838 RepID=A0A5S4F440_9ACTN|nr:hypothetical protein [Nonomuraea turkmeniaca]TMR10905.1 hypothetical protein ETD86_37715 [Nonomuraea turkmeniaca]